MNKLSTKIDKETDIRGCATCSRFDPNTYECEEAGNCMIDYDAYSKWIPCDKAKKNTAKAIETMTI